MKAHELKTIQPWFNFVKHGKKKFELRKNDRDFKAGDLLILKEWIQSEECYNKYSPDILVRIISVLKDFPGLEPGYCILSISEPI